jgi:hypothetical protein
MLDGLTNMLPVRAQGGFHAIRRDTNFDERERWRQRKAPKQIEPAQSFDKASFEILAGGGFKVNKQHDFHSSEVFDDGILPPLQK